VAEADVLDLANEREARSLSDLQLTFVPGDLAPAAGTFALWGAEGIADLATELGLPAGEAVTLRTVSVDDGGALRPADLPARTVPVLPVVRRLAELPPGSDWPAWRRPSDSVLAWSAAAKLALEYVVAGRVVPWFRASGDREGTAMWRVAPPDDGRLALLADALPLAAHALRRREDDAAVWEPQALLRAFGDAVADLCGRAGQRPEVDPRRRGPKRPWSEMWVGALGGSEPIVDRLRVDPQAVADEVDEWAAALLGREERGLARLAVRLEPPRIDPRPDDEDAPPLELADRPWHLRLVLQATFEPSEVVAAAGVWDLGGGALELGGRRIEDANETLVRGLATAARLFPPLDRALSEATPTGVDLEPAEVAAFLSDGADALGSGGIGVLVPPELREAEAKRLRARIRIGATTERDQRVPEDDELSLPSLTEFSYEVALGDDALSDDEFAELVALKQPLVRWRGQWVRIDQEQLDTLAELKGSTGTLDITEALAAALSGQREHGGLGYVETVADGDVHRLIERLRAAGGPSEATIVDIHGDVRDYQRRGIGWLQSLSRLGMGGILADDMGLGKTLMAIGLLTSRTSGRPHLVVCPTSVVGNWERELRRFAPSIPVIKHHGPERPNYRKAFRAGHVIVTSYALLRRDVHLLEDIDWDVVVFDEAQQVKNSSSKGARAARSLDAQVKFALTGTPIENRLSELWAILDLVNPGLLGSQRRFNERFAVPIERWHEDDAAERLRRLIAPFVLRRLKSDPDVSVDLPPKQEITVPVSLTREQATLYQAAVDDAFSGKGLGATTFERRGRILALITALKQICNHPRQYLQDGGRLTGRSGKLARVTEVLQEVVASGDRALVFTQYKVMGQLLQEHLGRELDLPEVPFLHGGVTLPRRDAMVERFQDDEHAPPLLLVSLRAGGTGLNLTRATEVIHYDRWWNPAVEQQATDRAHRIGQTRTVTVHKLVTAGTIEERIDELLQRKRALAESVVGEGEAWITELGDDELRELVALNASDVDDDEDAA
jgi:superfamily II DNA or RNA helicase